MWANLSHCIELEVEEKIRQRDWSKEQDEQSL
jgi:hypothetical protein